MLRAPYTRGKSSALSVFSLTKVALLSPQEEQAFGYGDAAQRANQIHGVAGQHVPGRGMGMGGSPDDAFNHAHDAHLQAQAGGGAPTKSHNLDRTRGNPLLEGSVSAAPSGVAKSPASVADGTQTGIVPKVGGGTMYQAPGAGPQVHPAHVPAAKTQVGPTPMNMKAPAAGGGRMQQIGRQAMQMGQKAWANPWARGAALVGGGLAAGGLAGHMMTGNGADQR